MTRSHRARAVVATVGAICLTACSSASGGVSQSKLENKLKSEPVIQTLLHQGGTKAQVTDQLVGCVATALEKNASQSDLKKYVAGKMNLNDVGGKTKGSANNAAAEVRSCAATAANKDRSSAPA